MKIIDIPAPIDAEWVVMNDGMKALQRVSAKMTFVEWLQTSLDNYKPLGKGFEAAEQGRKIFLILKGVNGNPSVKFEDADFKVVEAAPAHVDWSPGVNRNAVEFWKAIKNAQDVQV